jgi:segregation and condensation protein B
MADDPPLKLHPAEELQAEDAQQPTAPVDDDGSKQAADDSAESVAIVEAVLFAADTPLRPAKIAEIASLSGAKAARNVMDALNQRYAESGSAFSIENVADGYQMLTLPQYHPYLHQLLRVRQESRLSQAALETLAIVAYKQPILRADVEAVRGVACGEMLNRLRELDMIKIVGRAEDVGRPILYGTTKRFLEVFGLGSMDDLPSVEELPAPE